MANQRAQELKAIGVLDISSGTDGATPVTFREPATAYLDVAAFAGGWGATGKAAVWSLDVYVGWVQGTNVNKCERHYVTLKRTDASPTTGLGSISIYPLVPSGKVTFDIVNDSQFRVLVDPDSLAAHVAVLVVGIAEESDQ